MGRLVTAAAIVAALGGAVLIVVATGSQAAQVAHVYKTPACGCCNAWVDHLRRSGFEVETEDRSNLIPVKQQLGVAPELGSCHTAVVDGYVIEGHVPADVIQRLLAERPDIAGLAVPGMPIGSPGMEGPNPEPYEIVAFDRAGNRFVYDRR